MKPQKYFENMKFFCYENRKSIEGCDFEEENWCPKTCYHSQNFKPDDLEYRIWGGRDKK